MSRRRGSALLAGVFATAMTTGTMTLAGCAGLGLPPAAPISTPGAGPSTGTSATSAPDPTGSGTTAAGQPDPTGGAATHGTGGPTDPSATPTDGSSSPASEVPGTVTRMAGGNGSAVPLLVPTSTLPSGWTATKARHTRGYRMTVCGVDLEPTEPVDGAQQNWQRSAAGPYLEQHIRVYPDATATKVVGALAKKLPGCRTYTAKDGKGQSTFAVERLPLKGAPSGTVAWRQRVDLAIPVVATPTTTADPPDGASDGPTPTPRLTTRTVQVVQDVAVRRVGAAVLLFNAYAVEKTPDDTALVAALTG